MNSTALNQVMKSIVLPSRFTKKGRLAYYTLEHESGASIVVGLYLDTAIDNSSFVVQYFVQCLYVPFPSYIFSLGDRIGSHWEETDIASINQKIAEFTKFDNLHHFNDFISFLAENPSYGEGRGRKLYFALTHFIQKEYEQSLQFLDEIIGLTSETNPEWLKQDIINAQFIKSCIEYDEYQKGIDQILEWQKRTVSAIQLKM